MPRIRAEVEEARARADEWIDWIERDEVESGLPPLPMPDGDTCACMAVRAWDLVEEDPALAEAIGSVIVGRTLRGPLATFRGGELLADGLLILAEARRRRGDLDAAEKLQRRVRIALPRGFADPLTAARLLEEEAEVLAARGRYAQAAAKACEALRECEAFAFESSLDRLRHKIAEWVAASDPPGGSAGPRRVT